MHKTIFALLLASAACGGGTTTTNTPHPTDQVAWGQELYAKNCASCHGDHGEGGVGPAVVGKDVLGNFKTGKDVFDFVKANMPPKKAGSLKDEEYAAILAFDLKANGVDMTGKTVDATTAPSFVLHP
jgi:cytochrome c